MLTSILPGFRKVRTPLVTGYLYFAALWLIFGKDLVPSKEDEGFAGNVADLFDLFGPIAATATLSVAAYLVGSVLVIARWPIVRNNEFSIFREGFAPTLPVSTRKGDDWVLVGALDVHQTAMRRMMDVLDLQIGMTAIKESRELSHQFKITVAIAQERYQREQERNLFEFGDDPDYSGADWDTATIFALTQGFLADLPGEIGRAVATVRIRFSTLWDEYDQLRAEAEFRYSIAPPLLLVCAVATLTWTPWALLSFVAPAVLLWQGLRAERASISTILDIISTGIVTPPTIMTLRRMAGLDEHRQGSMDKGNTQNSGQETRP